MIRLLLAAALLSTAAPSVRALEGPAPAAFSLIIDDLGDRLDWGLATVELPGAITCSILPGTPYARRLAEAAHRSGKEVMLHQPMEAMGGYTLGPGGLGLNMSREEFLRTLRANLDSIPHVRGLNNHMGSLITRHPGHMAWLMAELKARGGLYFVDSRTTPATVSRLIAAEHAVAELERDVFLDHSRDPAAIRAQFSRLIATARRRGTAIGIGHPYPETRAVLEELLPRLGELGIGLVPVSGLLDYHNNGRSRLWQASWSPSPPAAKSSKP